MGLTNPLLAIFFGGKSSNLFTFQKYEKKNILRNVKILYFGNWKTKILKSLFKLKGDQSVYSIATEKDISDLMQDYRRKKGHLSLPSHQQAPKINPFSLNDRHQQGARPIEPVPSEIEKQRSSSIMKVGLKLYQVRDHIFFNIGSM